MNMRTICLGAAIVLSMFAGLPGTASAAVSPTDRTFVAKAGAGGLAEVADSKLALTKGGPAIRSIAQHMISDHTAANAQLAVIARRIGINFPAHLSAADRAAIAEQRGLNGMAFSLDYLHAQQTAHVQTIALFQHEIAAGSNRELVAFAKSTLPTLQHHLMMIQRVLNHI
jgi:putative membrane protein